MPFRSECHRPPCQPRLPLSLLLQTEEEKQKEAEEAQKQKEMMEMMRKMQVGLAPCCAALCCSWRAQVSWAVVSNVLRCG